FFRCLGHRLRSSNRDPTSSGADRSSLGLRESSLKAFQKHAPIGKSSKCVVQGIVSQLLFDFFAGGYIPIRDDQLGDLSFRISNGACRRFQNSPASVFVPNSILQTLANARLPRQTRGLQTRARFSW